MYDVHRKSNANKCNNNTTKFRPLLACLTHLESYNKSSRAQIRNETSTYRAYLPVKVNQRTELALLDSGNLLISVISKKFYDHLNLPQDSLVPVWDLPTISTAKKGAALHVLGRLRQPLTITLAPFTTPLTFRPLVINNLAMPINISGAFMHKNNISQMHGNGTVVYDNTSIKLWSKNDIASRKLHSHIRNNEATMGQSNVYAAKSVTVKPNSISVVDLDVPAVFALNLRHGDAILSAIGDFETKTNLCTPKSAVIRITPDGKATTTVLNPTDLPVKMNIGTCFGTVQHSETNDITSEVIAALSPEHAQLDVTRETSSSKTADLPKIDANKEEKLAWIRKESKLNTVRALKDGTNLAQAEALLLEFFDLFSDGSVFGKTTLLEHNITLNHDAPIRLGKRRMNLKLVNAEKEQVKTWLAQGIIEPSASEYSFPLIPVPKKDGSTRFCVDYRKLNDITFRDSFPLPIIEENLHALQGSRVFSALDNVGAFHSVPVKRSDCHKTAFVSSEGLFQFVYMPFGLMNGPPTYSRLVQLVLKKVPSSMALPYLDDVCVHSKDIATHLVALRKVFQAYRDAGLKLKPSKCALFQDEITYLGHDVSAAGIKPSKKHVEIIKDWPMPETRTQIRTFLGILGYHSQHIQNYAAAAEPLRQYQREVEPKMEKKVFEMSFEAQTAFLRLREVLRSGPILAYPDWNSPEPFIVDTDWSHDASCIGGVLSQKQNGIERVIAYSAKRLKGARLNYSSNKGEIWAIIHFLTHWRHHLLGRKFIIRTDHQAIQWLNTMAEPKGMITRWLDLLSNFEYEIKFRPGHLHSNADALSRTSHAPLEEDDPNDDDAWRITNIEVDNELLDSEKLLRAQREDCVVGTVREWVLNDAVLPMHKQLKRMNPHIRDYKKLLEFLFINTKGLLCLRNKDQCDQVCLPQTYWPQKQRPIFMQRSLITKALTKPYAECAKYFISTECLN